QEVVDLGTVAPQLAADFLLELTVNADDEVAEDAVFAACLADAEVWPELLDLARDRRYDDEVRQSAIVWLSRFAGEKVTTGLVKLVDDDDEDLEVRETAIFALSQHSGENAVPQLTRIALENPHPQLREQALFWLAQNDDPRVLALFEEILTGD
ncbi:MAG: HEAT repeat domain-containing protein, partial [bacterium]